ncbi:MAG: hypothetical protein ACO3F3_19290, partial [Gemmataceae bacterium]
LRCRWPGYELHWLKKSLDSGFSRCNCLASIPGTFRKGIHPYRWWPCTKFAYRVEEQSRRRCSTRMPLFEP